MSRDEIAAWAGAILGPLTDFSDTGSHRHQLARAERLLGLPSPRAWLPSKEIGCVCGTGRNDVPDMTMIGRSASARAPDGWSETVHSGMNTSRSADQSFRP
jgi:hypothetical protein